MTRTTPDVLNPVPAPSERRIALRVSAAAERTLRQNHPWIYDQAIARQSDRGQPGDLAVIFDRDRKFLAIGLYDPTSPIRVRILQGRKPAPIDGAWFEARLRQAVDRRAPLAGADTTAYRLVHGENDGLPGLVIDRYDHTLVLKLYTLAWVPHLRTLIDAMARPMPAKRLVLRLSRSAQAHRKHLHGLSDGLILSGPPLDEPIVFLEHGLRFEADPIHGQKTGFFLDQRDNRARIEPMTANRAVLDAFAYTGGFSVYAARGHAREVLTVDVSRPALSAARRNMALNRRHPAVGSATHRLITGDGFDVLENLRSRKRRFDVVIVDPPSFAATQAQVKPALRAYDRLTRLALGVLAPKGTLMIGCCSTHIGAQTFFSTVQRAASAARRPLQVLSRTQHPLDHPITFPEGAYLKALFAIA